MDVRLLGTPATLQRQLAAGESADDRLGNDAVEQLAGAVGVGGPDDVHRKLQELVHRLQIHVERDFGGGIGAGGLDRFILF